VKGKERQTVGELYDMFESLASELWPEVAEDDHMHPEDDEGSLEDQIAKELATLKRPRKEQRLANCQINTPCVVFISCKPPVDPVRLVTTLIHNVHASGVTQSKYVHRLVPVSGSCLANIPEIQSLCRRLFKSAFDAQGPSQTIRYKIEARIRNHTTLDRPLVIQEIAKCVPEKYTVDLEDPQLVILVEVFKSVCGISVVEDYYRFKKFNILEVANERNGEKKFKESEGRVHDKEGVRQHIDNMSA
jgi:tRNA acetyltransferase TAN1